MQPTEYISKYQLNQSSSEFDQNEFIADFTNDFISAINIFLRKEGRIDYLRFDGYVEKTRMKFDAISSKMYNSLDEDIWNDFYNTTVQEVREKLFKEYLKAQRSERERQASWYYNEGPKNAQATCNITSKDIAFRILGLSEGSYTSREEIISKFRKLSLKYHPDKNNNADNGEYFKTLVKAKDEALKYVQ